MNGDQSRFRIPNLWGVEPKASYLYTLFVFRLHGRHERTIEACRAIRGMMPKNTDTYLFAYLLRQEISALCKLGRYRSAAIQLRRHDRECGFTPNILEAPPEELIVRSVQGWNAQLPYFLGRYEEGARILERCIEAMMSWKRIPRRDLFGAIRNPFSDPLELGCVGLNHYYARLGKSLTEWSGWEPFVRSIASDLLGLCKLKRQALLEDPELLQRVRATSIRIDEGKLDYRGSKARLRKERAQRKVQMAEFEERARPAQEFFTAKLKRLFPELDEPEFSS